MNGVDGPLDAADAWDIAGMLEATGRAVPRERWVAEMIAAREAQSALSVAAGF